MTTEIKFRGKRVDYGEWIVGTPVFYRDGHVAIYDGMLMLYGAEATTLCRHKVAPATVGQYTGLKDKNGVEIYVGDRINWKGMDFADYMQYPDDLIDVVDLDISYSYEWFRSSIEQCEVIGNIHDGETNDK